MVAIVCDNRALLDIVGGGDAGDFEDGAEIPVAMAGSGNLAAAPRGVRGDWGVCVGLGGDTGDMAESVDAGAITYLRRNC